MTVRAANGSGVRPPARARAGRRHTPRPGSPGDPPGGARARHRGATSRPSPRSPPRRPERRSTKDPCRGSLPSAHRAPSASSQSGPSDARRRTSGEPVRPSATAARARRSGSAGRARPLPLGRGPAWADAACPQALLPTRSLARPRGCGGRGTGPRRRGRCRGRDRCAGSELGPSPGARPRRRASSGSRRHPRGGPHPVGQEVSGREHQDRRPVSRGAQPLAHGEPVQPGHQDVEDHDVRAQRVELRQRVCAVRRAVDRVALEAQDLGRVRRERQISGLARGSALRSAGFRPRRTRWRRLHGTRSPSSSSPRTLRSPRECSARRQRPARPG